MFPFRIGLRLPHARGWGILWKAPEGNCMKKNYADMDPVEEIRAIRAELMSEFKTLDALCEYLRPQKISLQNPKAGKKKRKSAKRLAHA